ncbi:diguanylate cyclase [Sphingomonas sp. Leaf10]|nr:diguanylate cyclase [Sphingomonas sp. Leaf10]
MDDERSSARILIVDDDAVIDESRPLSPGLADGVGTLADFAADLSVEADRLRLIPTYVHRGEDAVAAVAGAVRDDARFAVAFLDICGPCRIDLRQTVARIRALDPDLQIVIVTGHAADASADITCDVRLPDHLFHLTRPLDAQAAWQTARALAHRWLTDRELAATRAALTAKIAELEERARELAANESKAIHMAHHDPLTDAPNRLAFLRVLTDSLRGTDCVAMAMIDLDRFKLINDTLGHLVGDELIRIVCEILIEQVGDAGFVARLGGDEFGVLLRVADEADAMERCERLVRACSTDLLVFGHPVRGAASIGVVMAKVDGGRDPVDVMRRADMALNDAKRSGRGVVRRFDDSMDESIRFRRGIEQGLTRAIAQGEMALLYQPIVARETLDIVAFEALLRWNTPDFRDVSPAMFVPIAEESNLIHELGDWVLDKVLMILPRLPGQYISVNVSARQFRRPNFTSYLIDRVQRAGIAPDRLQIEVTETAIFDNAERAAATLLELRELGFRIALDDFGTGYSSLYNIRTFALDCLKIDRSFIDGMGRERESAAIVHSIIHLARALRLEVVAEGVETEAQVQALRVAGCSHLQGHHFARPLDADGAIGLAAGGIDRRWLSAIG